MNFQAVQSSLTDEERMLIRRAAEMRERAKSGSVQISRFLTPRESFILTVYGLAPEIPRSALTSEEEISFFWGGYEASERKCFVSMPSYLAYSLPESDAPTATPAELAKLAREELSAEIIPLFIKASGYVNLTHRDYLGALVGLGIERSVLGDILLVEGGAIVFASSAIVDFLRTELKEVGRDKVKVIDAPLDLIKTAKREFEQISGTVASARLDAVVGELTHASRETAKELIRRGLVEHNFFEASDCDAEVTSGDLISVRREGKIRNGKYAIDSIGEPTAKGRLRFAARRYL